MKQIAKAIVLTTFLCGCITGTGEEEEAQIASGHGQQNEPAITHDGCPDVEAVDIANRLLTDTSGRKYKIVLLNQKTCFNRQNANGCTFEVYGCGSWPTCRMTIQERRGWQGLEWKGLIIYTRMLQRCTDGA